MHFRRAAGIGVLGLLLVATSSRADALFTPFIGPNFGGQTVDERLHYGAALGVMGGGWFGFELDVGHSPNFFGRFPFGTFDSGRVTTATANLMVGAPIGGQWGTGVRPYVTGGLGLMRLHVNGAAALTRHDAAANVGGGLMGFVSDNVGFRGDVRYFRNFDRIEELNLGHFDYWRGAVGLVFRWGQ